MILETCGDVSMNSIINLMTEKIEGTHKKHSRKLVQPSGKERVATALHESTVRCVDDLGGGVGERWRTSNALAEAPTM